MPNLTSNFSFNLPLVNDPVDEDLWGSQLNTNWTSLDGILPVPAASKYGAIAVQSTDDAGFEILSDQGDAGEILVSQGADALPVFTALYPVGSIYMNKSDSTNPGTLFGFGTWTAITDKFVVARGGTYTGTGGAATVTLSAGNLPSHQHFMFHSTSTSGDQTAPTATDYATVETTDGNDAAYKISRSASSGASVANVGLTSSTGSGSSFSIIPPYQAVYMWERTA